MCIAIAAGRAGVDRAGRAELRDRADPSQRRPRLGGQPRPLLAEQQHARAAAAASVSMGTEPGRLSTPTTGELCRRAQAGNAGDVVVVAHVLVALGHHRAPAVPPPPADTCTSRARKALAVRTTDPMLKSCCQFSIATWKSCRRGPGRRRPPPVASSGSGRRRCAGRRPRAARGRAAGRPARARPTVRRRPRPARSATPGSLGLPGGRPDLSPDLGTLTAGAVYAVVLGFVFVESGLLVGFFLPGDSILFAAGLVRRRARLGRRPRLLVAGGLHRRGRSATPSAT